MIQEKPQARINRAAERRAAKRHVSVFLLAKVTTAHNQALGRVLNLSQHGAKIETRLGLNPGDALTLEIRSDLKAQATVRWARGQWMGVEFDHPVDVERFLTRQQDKLSRVRPRAPRYMCDAKATVSAESETSVLKVRDVSLSGAGLAGEAALGIGDEVIVTIFGLQSRRAKVVWANSKGVGITFLMPLDFRDFEAWLNENAGQPWLAADD